MRVDRMQNCAAFGQLYVETIPFWYVSDATLDKCKERLANTKHVDVVLDSHGLAIKKKMTDILLRIQSFSLYTLENAIGINMNGDKKESIKFKFDSLEEAKSIWKRLADFTHNSHEESYTETALFMDNNFDKII